MSNIIPFVCPFCGYEGPLELMGADRFPILQQLQVIGAGRRAARCPKCESTDKERLVFLFLKDIVRTEKPTSQYIAYCSRTKSTEVVTIYFLQVHSW